MLNALLETVVQHYSGPEKNSITETPDIIAILSYGTYREKLVAATRENIIRGVRIWKQFPEARIIFGNAEYLFERAAYTEARFKKEILRKEGVPDSHIVDIGIINNSIDEARGAQIALDKIVHPKKICLVTGRMHKPSAYLIWKYFFPEADIEVVTIPHRYEYEPDHPVLVQRGPWRWLCANFARHFLFWIFGPAVGNFHHRASVK